ncbi:MULTISPECIES: ribosome hibernation-promoting factor, HPF/YfiA family [Vibrio]|uniref:Ribosomal subunit interface protein n=2 Tax=Vibrio genomosp. F10 TaxID=723171 RepID=A0A1B9R2S7_9VIBR|nr:MULTISPECIES: ribosome-associated translation inhibitor RaiA [Vibrio]OCH78485.1 ribosomal subunit interface protein [Vibrio genomosp. F10]OEE34660.1 ribosomal subunit interface protein [Vibrio genomosp. F10 str. ZF-129]OEE93751.1 ribosomal subunit interface protein [Vibrio genomosp. F10 str. 9ZC157]OEE94467.1 ribosomal subunit interface protein [Vibrio genomosp. F10 str. 9ZD137]OEF05114.1 ribosomal subunit interface protein [Vibrio genomosp. F10 str. 9ZB36]
MKVNVQTHHVSINEDSRKEIESKFDKITAHFPHLISCDIIITKEHGTHEVEIFTNYEGVRISAKSTNDVMYPAISATLKKLETGLRNRKGQLKADLHEKPTSTKPEIASDIIQEMKLV